MAPRKSPNEAWYSPALDSPNLSEKNLALTRLMTMAQGSKGASVLKAGSDQLEGKGSTFYPFFVSAIIAGLVPPFSFSANTTCRLCISTPTLFFSWRFLLTIVRLTSG